MQEGRQVKKMEEKIKVIIKPLVGRNIPVDIDVDPREQVKFLKERAASSQSTDPNNVKLVYEGEPLDDRRRIKEYGIQSGATLTLAPKHDTGGYNPPYTFFHNLPMDFNSRISYESELIRANGLPMRPINPRHWIAVIEGRGKWKGKFYDVEMMLPPDYPFSPVQVRWITPIHNHPNIFSTGSVCLNLLKARYWRPEYTLITVYESLVNLLKSPNYEGVNRYLHPAQSLKRLLDELRREG